MNLALFCVTETNVETCWVFLFKNFQGFTGKQGIMGITGERGEDGPSGNRGPDGPDGPKVIITTFVNKKLHKYRLRTINKMFLSTNVVTKFSNIISWYKMC